MIGRSLRHYRIESQLGQGGMGVVYRALDTKLNRPVALKVLPQDAVADPVRKKRFAQEARAASALNHSNIVTIHDIDTADGVDFIVMEYVPGKSLDRMIARRPLPLIAVLHHAIEIADALAGAHAAGIVHRDLKPANIMVTDKGHVKVLDFGVAKLVERSDASESAVTKTAPAQTEEGTIVGTAAYMSPEQAEGKSVDARSDIFSFGVVLYEMVTGRRPFHGETTMATLAAVLHTEPQPISEATEGVPRELERVITYCLRKDPQRRLQHMEDLKIVLEGLRAELESGGLVQPDAAQRSTPRRLGWVIAAASVLVTAGAGAALSWQRSTAPAVQAPLIRLTSDTGLTTDPALSPDGRLVAYASDRAGADNLDIWVKQVEGGVPLRLTSDPADESEPSFSPDGNRIVFRSEREGGGIYTIAALGGEEPRLIAREGRGPRFSPDGARIAFVTGLGASSGGGDRGGLFVVPSQGGTPQPLVSETIGAHSAVWSPDSKWILFATGVYWAEDWGVVPSQATSQASPVLVPLTGFKQNTGLTDVVPHEWGEENRILFSARSGDSSHLFEIRLSPPGLTAREWRLDPSPKRLTYGTGQDERPSLAPTGSANGARRLVFASLIRSEHIWSLALDTNQPRPGGKIEQLTLESGFQIFPSVSADGTKLAFISHAAHNDEVWLQDLTTGKRSLLSTTISAKSKALIHADGSRVLWTQDAGVYAVASSGGAPEKLCDKCGWAWDWSADHKRILHHGGRSNSSVVGAITSFETGKRGVFLESPGKNLYGMLRSPDEAWILFFGEQAGRSQVYVAPIANDQASSEAAWIPITDGSTYDRQQKWSPDGNAVYSFSGRDGFYCLWAYPLDNRTKRPNARPVPVFHSHGARLSLRNAYAVFQEMSVARDKIVFNQGEITGNIWMTEIAR